MTIDVEPTDQVKEEQDTYRDPDRMYGIATWAERLALPVMLAILIGVVGPTGIQIYALLSNGATGTGLGLNLGYLLLSALRDLGLAALAYIVLQGVAQGLYMLMDIEEKTGPKA